MTLKWNNSALISVVKPWSGCLVPTGYDEMHLCVCSAVVSLSLQSKQLLSELHPQVTLHWAVVITWAAGLQTENGKMRRVEKPGEWTEVKDMREKKEQKICHDKGSIES